MTRLRLVVALCVLSPSIAAQNAFPSPTIKRFPHQDSTRVAEAVPVALSSSAIMIIWSDSTSVRCATSTNGGETWNAPVLIARPIRSANSLSGIRTSSGRIISCWRDGTEPKMTYSDDHGVSWLSPITLPVQSVLSIQISQTTNGKLWIGIGRVLMSSVFLWSTDNGATWSNPQSLPSPAKFDIGFINENPTTVHCFYCPTYRPSVIRTGVIERISSTDAGQTWSSPVTVVGQEVKAYRPRLLRLNDGTVRLLYEVARNDSFPSGGRTQFDIEYSVSTDNGMTWSEPFLFTRYVGNDESHNVVLFNNQPFVTFASERWTTERYPATQIWYGIIGQTPDVNPPPYLIHGSSYYPEAGVDNWIRAVLDDENGIAAVTATYKIGDIARPPVQLFDDGMHLDDAPNDNVWGNVIPPLPQAPIEFRFTITDLDGNTLHNRFGDAFTSIPPPQSSHVEQGTSMKIAFDNSAVFGRYSMASGNYPGFGIRYPVPSLIEHLYGGGIWIGGKVDTTSGGSGQRIKVVSTGYEGWFGPLREFFPPNPATDTVWRIFGRNAPKPPGWDEYWGTSLPYRAPADENFFCRYQDYFFRPVGHIPMGVRVIQSSFTWDDTLGHGIAIIEFRIMNNFSRAIDSAYIGFLADNDVGPITAPRYWDRNASGYYADLRTAYTFNPVDFGSTPIGLVILDTHRPFDSLRFTFQWYLGHESPSADVYRYALMSLGTIKPDEYPSMSESRVFVSFGPFTIRPFNSANPDTLRVAMGFVSGRDLNHMREAAVRARALYSTYLLDVAQEESLVPEEFALEQNFPNPFNPTTTIRVRIPEEQHVTLDVVDVLGRKVVTLISGKLKPGTYQRVFDGSGLSSGVYFFRVKAGHYMSVKKAMLLR